MTSAGIPRGPGEAASVDDASPLREPARARRRIRSWWAGAPMLFLLAAGIALANPTPPPPLPNLSLPAGSEPTLPPSVHLPKMPTTALHTVFFVDTNRKGQVTRVRSGTGSSNARYNLMTYGNALQAFIRTPSGDAVAGIFRLDYQYSPATGAVRRTVTLVRAGGVDPNALGAVFAMLQDAHRHAASAPSTRAK